MYYVLLIMLHCITICYTLCSIARYALLNYVTCYVILFHYVVFMLYCSKLYYIMYYITVHVMTHHVTLH